MNDLYIHDLDLPTTQRSNTLIYTKRVAIFAFITLLALASIRIIVNVQKANALQEYTTKTLERTVLITHAQPGDLKRTLALPTSLRGNNESIIYARTTGYVSVWYKGIGDQVKKGDLLATLEAPDQEQELAQARAQREQTAARTDLAEQTLSRWEALEARQSAISQQDLAEKRSLVRQGRADLNAADANVKRLEQLQSFRRITAPFAGIITRRSIEVGDLIASTGKELFAISQTDPLRATVWVPQAYAANLNLGAQVNLNIAEQSSAKIKANIERIAGGIDPATHARQVDLILENPNAKILPGTYAEVSIQLSSSVKTLIVPAAVLIVTDQTQRVAIVNKDKHLHFTTVKLGRDLGKDVEILDGITSQDTLVVSPSDQLIEDQLVETLAWQPASSEVPKKPGNNEKVSATEKLADNNKTPKEK